MSAKKINLVTPGMHHLKVVKQTQLSKGGHQLVLQSQDEPTKDTILLKLPRGHARTQIFCDCLFGAQKDELSAHDRLSLEKSVILAKITHSANGAYADVNVETALILKGEVQSEESREPKVGGQNARQVCFDLK